MSTTTTRPLVDALWISRGVPEATRQLRALPAEHVVWAEAGETLEQPFDVTGELVGVNFDLRFRVGSSPSGRVQLVAPDGAVIADAEMADWGIPPDRFSTFLVADPIAPPGSYVARLLVESGEIGWHIGAVDTVPESGTRPVQLMTPGIRGGVVQEGPFAFGVDVSPPPNPEFRRVIDLPSAPATATLHLTGLGEFVAYINGDRVGRGHLQPAQTVYGERVEYHSFDVAEMLRPGENEVVIRTGRGLWSVRGTNVWGWNLAPWTQEPVVIAALESTMPGGEHVTFVTDTNWTTRASDVTELFFTGITQRLGDSNADWEPAIVVPGPSGRLVEAQTPEVREAPPVEPVATTTRGSSLVYDFGRVLAGGVVLQLDGGQGELTVKYGEYLGDAGEVVCDNVLASGQAQVDSVIVERGGVLTWQPEFSYKGFRYIEVSPVGGVGVIGARAIPYVTDIAEVGSFSCDEPVLDWLVSATVASLRNNLHNVPTDTPVYEKNGWTADAHLVADGAIFHLGLQRMLTKWLDDHVDAQDESGVVPWIVPTPGWGTRLDPAWSGSMVLLPWNLYWEHGEPAILERYIEAMTRYVDRTIDVAEAAGWIWPLHSWGDWVAPNGGAVEGPAAATTMIVSHLTATLANSYRVLGDDRSAKRYDSARSAVNVAYNDAYFDADAGEYRVPGNGYRQTPNILPLMFDAVPAGHRRRVEENLVRDVEVRSNGHLNCGALGSKYLLPALTAGGRIDLAITVATQTDEPSWGLAMASGDGTLWETFEKTARSRDHYFLGSVSHWVHESIGGLRQTTAGWREFTLSPPLDARVRRASATHQIDGGAIRVEWERDDERWRGCVDVPAGTLATLALPGRGAVELGAGSHRFEESVVR